MTTCGSLSIEYCRKCKRDGLHAESKCVHCGTKQRYVRIRYEEKDAMGYKSRMRGVAKTAMARRKVRFCDGAVVRRRSVRGGDGG